ncbi:Clp protease [Salmonella enterica]|nr:Clp protease [Salmonella enterica]
MRIICVKSDISQLKELYGGEKGQTLAEGVWNNCNFTYRLRTLDD